MCVCVVEDLLDKLTFVSDQTSMKPRLVHYQTMSDFKNFHVSKSNELNQVIVIKIICR